MRDVLDPASLPSIWDWTLLCSACGADFLNLPVVRHSKEISLIFGRVKFAAPQGANRCNIKKFVLASLAGAANHCRVNKISLGIERERNDCLSDRFCAD